MHYDKALEYYEKCTKFAAPYSKAYSAEALMLAGWVCYLQRDDSAAMTNAQNALQMNPRLTEAYYTHAKFAAASGSAQIAILSALAQMEKFWQTHRIRRYGFGI